MHWFVSFRVAKTELLGVQELAAQLGDLGPNLVIRNSFIATGAISFVADYRMF